jgi:hypothetical protein
MPRYTWNELSVFTQGRLGRIQVGIAGTPCHSTDPARFERVATYRIRGGKPDVIGRRRMDAVVEQAVRLVEVRNQARRLKAIKLVHRVYIQPEHQIRSEAARPLSRFNHSEADRRLSITFSQPEHVIKRLRWVVFRRSGFGHRSGKADARPQQIHAESEVAHFNSSNNLAKVRFITNCSDSKNRIVESKTLISQIYKVIFNL